MTKDRGGLSTQARGTGQIFCGSGILPYQAGVVGITSRASHLWNVFDLFLSSIVAVLTLYLPFRRHGQYVETGRPINEGDQNSTHRRDRLMLCNAVTFTGEYFYIAHILLPSIPDHPTSTARCTLSTGRCRESLPHPMRATAVEGPWNASPAVVTV